MPFDRLAIALPLAALLACGAPSGDAEPPADVAAAGPQAEIEKGAEPGPAELWNELNALVDQMRFQTEQEAYAELPDLASQFGAVSTHLFALMHPYLELDYRVRVKRATFNCQQVIGLATRAADSSWPTDAAIVVDVADRCLKRFARQYPYEVLDGSKPLSSLEKIGGLTETREQLQERQAATVGQSAPDPARN